MATAANFRQFTREEYDDLVENGFFHSDDRVELVDGYLHEMTPQDSWHAAGVQALQEALIPLFKKGYSVRIQMPLALGFDSEPEPDVAIVRGHWREYRDAHPTMAVLVVEVAGASLLYDRNRKALLYARAGVPEYWLLNRREACLEVFRDPTNGEYGTQRVLRAGDTVSPLTKPGASIPISDLLP